MRFPQQLVEIIDHLARDVSPENDLGRSIIQLSESLKKGNESMVGFVLGGLRAQRDPYGPAFNLLFIMWGRSRVLWRENPELDDPDIQDLNQFARLASSFSSIVREVVHKVDTGPSGKNRRKSHPSLPRVTISTSPVLEKDIETGAAPQQEDGDSDDEEESLFRRILSGRHSI